MIALDSPFSTSNSVSNVVDIPAKVNVVGIPQSYTLTPKELKNLFAMRAIDKNSYLFFALKLTYGEEFLVDELFDIVDFCEQWQLQGFTCPNDPSKTVSLSLETADVLIFIGKLAKKGILGLERVTQLTLDLWGESD